MKRIIIILILFSFFGCENNEATAVDASNAISFVTLDKERTGIDFSNDLTYSTNLNIIEYLYYYNGGGVAVGDINNDGLEDLYFSANQLPDRLYLNTGNLTFKDISETAGLQMDSTWSNGVSMEDINNDGLLDIYVSKVGLFSIPTAHNLLYINNGDLTFTERSESYGLNFSGFSTQATFFDYDRDGDLDMYLLNHGIHSVRSFGTTKKRTEKDSLSGDRFYENKLNEGRLVFEEVTEKAGISNSPLGYGLAITTTDINNDGWLDIYVGNDFHENDYIYINNKDKTFSESGNKFIKHFSRFTMGIDVADMNNDGGLDIFTTDMMPYDASILLKSGGEDSDKITEIKKNYGFETQFSRNHFHVKKGYGDYVEIALKTETFATDWSWSVLLQDFDNDGWNDIFISNGIEKRPNDLDYIKYWSTVDYSEYENTKDDKLKKKLIDRMPTLKIPNVLFKNKGNLEFTPIKESFLGKPSMTNGTAYADLDNDGDLDLVLNNLNTTASILENKSSENTNFISIQLQGNEAYKIIKGAQVTLFAGGKKWIKEQQTTKGFQSSSSHRLFFGLGKITSIDSLKIRWADGKIQKADQFNINQNNTIVRSTNFHKQTQFGTPNSYTLSILPFKHQENTYLDYEVEQLIPEKLSMEGPAVVYEDFNKDGIRDLFLGGSRYQESKLYLGKKNNAFVNIDVEDFLKDKVFEDVDATSFDFDADGDLDIYVVSGGNDYEQGNDLLMDRVYINDGKAGFTRLNIPLPKTNGGTVEAADFDKDGFEDLFVGSRSIPGAYGVNPDSFLLKNNGEMGFEISFKKRLGMVTDSKWADINKDGLLDLVVVGDWMPITVVFNKGDNVFEVADDSIGMSQTHGLWNTVYVEDIDGDGSVDILAGNTGTNFKWKPTIEKPVWLYLDDFDENEQLDPIIMYDYFGDYVPFSSKDNLAAQLPFLKKKFNTYKEYATVRNIYDLVAKEEQDILGVKKIVESRSMIYLQKNQVFEGHPLSAKAQISSIEDFYIDKKTSPYEIYYVGNNNGYITNLGQSSSNTGGVLSNWNSSTNTFDKDVFLPISTGINAKRVLELDSGDKFIMANNDYVYLLNKTQSNEN